MTTAKSSRDLIVKIDGKGVPNARVLQVRTTINGGNSDSAVFEIRRTHTRADQALAFKELRDVFADKLAEIILDADGQLRRIFLGRTTNGSFELHDEGETIRYTARMEPHLISKPFEFRWVATRDRTVSSAANAESWIPAVLREHAVFNPIMDGLIYPNKMKVDGIRLFVDPESVEPEALEEARTLRREEVPAWIELPERPDLWTLPDIVEYWIGTLLNDKYFAIPHRREFERILEPDARLVRNLKIKLGEYLPAILDKVLRPYGYGWCVKYQGTKPTLSFFKMGDKSKSPASTWALLQAPGDIVDFTLSDARRIDIDFDLTDQTADEILLLGDYEYREGTFELVPAWDPIYDVATAGLTLEDFIAGSDKWREIADVSRVWRDWVLNEAGDYTGLRDSITKAYSFRRFFQLPVEDKTILRRRKFFETLSRTTSGTAAGESRGILVEWSPDAGENWYNVRGDSFGIEHGTSFQPLENECGVRFSNTSVFPKQMYNAGVANCKVRVTATVRNDSRLQYRIKRKRGSLLAEPKTLVLDLRDKYRYRKIQLEGGVGPPDDPDASSWQSQFWDVEGIQHPEVDETKDLKKLAERLIEAWDRASANGRVVRFGLYVDDVLGGVLERVFGRDIGFAMTHERTKPALFPTISGVTYDVQQQTTTYMLDTPKNRT
jgi:hypothetical protein